MSEAWLSIIGLGEDGVAGLCDASRLALNAADVVFGGPRHLPLAEKSCPGIGDLYRELADQDDKPATFLQLLWIYEGRRAAARHAPRRAPARRPR